MRYLLGILLVGASIAVDLLILHLFPAFGVPGVLTILAILLTALAWGAGPGLVATLVSVALFDYFDLAPNLIIARLGAALLADDFLFILVGVAISLIAIQIQRARRNAEASAALLEAERARSELERQRLQTVLDVLPVGVAIADARGRVLAINDAFQELRGEAAPLLSDITEYDTYKGWWPATGKLIAAQEWAMARALTSGEVCSGEEVEIETFDGQRKAAINTAAPIRDDTGAIIGGVVTMLDITERQARRLDRLVNDLLDVSRIQTGKLMMHRQTADLAAIVAEMVEEQRQAAPERGIHLHLPDQSVLLSIDAERIAQVVTNYLTNALKYSTEDQPVEVGLELEADAARVWVRDQGPGLPSEEQTLIWERFHRVPGIEVRSGSGVGLGLGLHISRTIIEAHQGRVGVQSAPGAGATFWFCLPLSSAD